MYDNEISSHEKMDVAWQCISERLWKCLVGWYGGCFEEDIMRLMMTESIMPRVWMHRLSMRQLSRWEREMHGTEEARKTWVVEVWTFEYSNLSEELMHLLSLNLNLIRRFTKRQVPRGGVYGGLVILAHPRPMVRECTLIFDLSRD